VGADDGYDEEKYCELLEKAAEEVDFIDSNPSPLPITPLPRRERGG
jgi:hypothetical protein